MTISGMLNQSVVLATYHSTNYTGDVSYNADLTLNARVSYRQKLVYNRAGAEVMSFCKVTVSEEIEYEDLLTLTDGIKRVPLSIRHARGRDGTLHHSGVFL